MLTRIRSKGFTLLEVSIAMFIFATGALSLAVLAIWVINNNVFAHQLIVASTQANNKVEEIRAAKFDSITNGQDVFSNQGVMYQRQWTITNLNGDPEVKNLVVIVNWVGNVKPHSVEMKTIISKEGMRNM